MFCNYGVEVIPHLSVLRILTIAFYISVYMRKSNRLILLNIPLKRQFILLLLHIYVLGYLMIEGVV